MKTINQYREEIKAMLEQADKMTAQATAENRDLTKDELAARQNLYDVIKTHELKISDLEEREMIHNRLEGSNGKPKTVENAKQKPPQAQKESLFPSFGEFLVAAMRAGVPGGQIDPRLFNAATGLGESVQSDGGFLVQQDFTNELLQEVFQTGVLASRCRRMPISGNANGMKINGVDETSRASTRYGGIIGYWKDEAALKVASKPKFRQIELNLHKLIGLCYATDELLADATALEAFIRQAFVGEFGFLLDDAIINGTGAGQPLGVLNAGCLVAQAKETGQRADTVVAENIVKMYARRFAGQTSNYAWFYNQNIEPQLYTMSLAVGTGGIPIYMPPGGLSDAPYARLMGLPAIAIEQAASLGDQGDIILANFQNGYVMAEKGGIQADMSIHVQFLYDESVFRFVLRVDGQPVRASALTPYKGGATATQSHFITLAERA